MPIARKTARLCQTYSGTLRDYKVVNTFSSTDKKAHTIHVVQRDRMKGGGFRYGTSGTFNNFDGAERTNVTGYGAKVDTSKASAFDNSIGQVVFGSKATTWANSGYYGNDFYALFNVSVKAGGAAGYNVAYTIVTDDSKTTAQIGAALK